MLRVLRGRATVFAGGMGGPAIAGGVLLNVYTGEEGDHLGLVVRAPDSVHAMVVETDVASVRMPLHASGLIDGVRIGGAVFKRGQSIRSIQALDKDGNVVADQGVRRLRPR